MDTPIVIEEISYPEICEFWRLYNTVKIYTPTSSYVFGGGYDLDYHNRTPLHAGIRIAGKLIAVVSGHLTSPKYYRFRSLSVDPRFRRYKLGTRLIDHMADQGRIEGADYLWTMPGESYFYLVFQPYGFEKVGRWVYDGMHTPPNCFARKEI